MQMKITFPGGLRVNAQLGEQVIATDQGVASGGEGSAPEPFTLFMASIGTCAGIYVLSFCKNHGLPTEGVYLTQREEPRLALVRPVPGEPLTVATPAGSATPIPGARVEVIGGEGAAGGHDAQVLIGQPDRDGPPILRAGGIGGEVVLGRHGSRL